MEVVLALAPHVVVETTSWRIGQPREVAQAIWDELRDSEAQEETAAIVRRRSRRRSDDAEDRRVSKALGLVQMGELSAGRAALEAAELAPGTNATLQQLQDPVRRPPRSRERMLEHLLTEMPVAQFDMEEHKFLENLRSARKGVAPGPSGMTCEHLRPLLENPLRFSHVLPDG